MLEARQAVVHRERERAAGEASERQGRRGEAGELGAGGAGSGAGRVAVGLPDLAEPQTGVEVEGLEEGQRPLRLGTGEQQVELLPHPFRGDADQRRRSRAGQGEGRGVGGEAGELDQQPGQAQDAQGVAGEGLRSGRPQAALAQVREPSERVVDGTAGGVEGDGVDREVAAGQIGVEPGPLAVPEVEEVAFLAVVVMDDEPERSEPLAAEVDQAGREGVGGTLGDGPTAVGDRGVEVAAGEAEEAVAEDAADQVGLDPFVRGGPPQGLDRRVGEQELEDSHRVALMGHGPGL